MPRVILKLLCFLGALAFAGLIAFQGIKSALQKSRPQRAPTFTYVAPKRPTIKTITDLDRHALQNYALPRLMDTLGNVDLREMSRRARLLTSIQPIPNNRTRTELGSYLEQQLYGFVLNSSFGSLENMKKSYMGGGRGIVISTGNHYSRFAIHLIKSLRSFNCTLPIEVWYNGSKDLNSTHAVKLQLLPGVRLRNIQDIFRVSMEGWDVKPFALLASSFQEAMLLDADTVFLRDPVSLFNDPGFIKTGALFFKDRSLFPGQIDKANWVLQLFPEPHSFRLRKSRILQAKSQYDLESGVVVLDKQRHFYGLLMACRLNCPGPIKSMIRDETHGEKETFWMGLEMLDEPYSYMPHAPGSLGTVAYNENDRVEELCGKLVHFDREGQVLWFNDGIAASKLPNDFFITEVTELTHLAREEECEWDSLCLRNGPFHKLNLTDLKIIENLKGIYQADNQSAASNLNP